MTIRKAVSFLALAGVVFILYVRFLNWGTPSEQKHIQLFGSMQNVSQYAPHILELRHSYYKGLEQLADPDVDLDSAYEHAYDRNLPRVFFEPLNRDFILDKMRGYLIGTQIVDDQIPLNSLNDLRQSLDRGFKIRFIQALLYGGAYLGCVAFFLLLGSFFHLYSLSTDLMWYILHPQEVQNMYFAIRLISPVAIFIVAWTIFARYQSYLGARIAGIAALVFVFVPGLCNSQFVKPHSFSMMWLAVGFYLYWKSLDDDAPKLAWFAGAALGLSAGSIISNLSVFIVPLIQTIVFFDFQWRAVLSHRSLYKTWVGAVAFFLLTNFYILFNIPEFIRAVDVIRKFTSGYGNTYGSFHLQYLLDYLHDFLRMEVGYFLLIFFIAGLFFVRKNKFFLAVFISWSVLFLLNLLTTRHPGVNMRSLPFFSIVCAYGINFLLFETKRLQKVFGIIIVVIGLSVTMVHAYFYSTLFREPTNIVRAGDWINRNIPPGSTVGIRGGIITQSYTPVFRMLDYSLVYFPEKTQGLTLNSDKFPEFVISNSRLMLQGSIEKKYFLIAEWPVHTQFLRIPFHNDRISGDNPVFLYRLLPEESNLK